MGKSPDYLFWIAIEEIAYAFMEKKKKKRSFIIIVIILYLKREEKKKKKPGDSDPTLNDPKVNSWQTKLSQMTLDLMGANSSRGS